MLANVVQIDAHEVQLLSDQLECVQADLVYVTFGHIRKVRCAHEYEQLATRPQQLVVDNVERVVEHNQTPTRSNI